MEVPCEDAVMKFRHSCEIVQCKMCPTIFMGE